MESKEIKELYQKYLNGTLTPLERNQWSTVLNEVQNEDVIKALMDADYQQLSQEDLLSLREERSGEILAEVVSKTRLVRRRLWPRIVIAAAVLLVLFTTAIFYFDSPRTNDSYVKYDADVAPGKSGATLTLSNGKKIYINNAQAGELALEAGVSISKDQNGLIVYDVIEKAGSADAINVLETSIGEQAQVRLPDGTSVYLNAGSSMKYPSSFIKKNKRIVELLGEAYFEVAKDKTKPFLVKTTKQEVEVLGTQFNVSNYPNDPSIKTTLVEGSIKLTTPSSQTVLKPGQQAKVSAQQIKVVDVITDYAIAWKQGYFMFDHESLEQIMQKLARWYNVEIEFKDSQLKQRTFFGTISRFENISKVLGIMQATHVASFEIQNNKVIISKN